MRADAGQIALGKCREPLVEGQRDDAVQDCVADELEPLVVGNAVASVRERLSQQVGVRERVVNGDTDRVVVI